MASRKLLNLKEFIGIAKNYHPALVLFSLRENHYFDPATAEVGEFLQSAAMR